MQAVRNTFTFATMGHGMGGGGGSRGGESARRADRCCWRCYLCFVGVQHAAFGVFTTVFIVAVAASSLSLSLSLLPLAPCHMPHAPTCPNGKQIYALSSKNLYGMQVPQLVAGKRSKKKSKQTKQWKNMFEKMLQVSISISIPIRLLCDPDRYRTHPARPHTHRYVTGLSQIVVAEPSTSNIFTCQPQLRIYQCRQSYNIWLAPKHIHKTYSSSNQMPKMRWRW